MLIFCVCSTRAHDTGEAMADLGVHTSPLFKYMGLIIRPNLHGNSYRVGWGRNCLVYRVQYKKISKLLVPPDVRMTVLVKFDITEVSSWHILRNVIHMSFLM